MSYSCYIIDEGTSCKILNFECPTFVDNSTFAVGLFRELDPGPLAPEARIMPLDQAASWLRAHLLIYGPMHAKKRISAKHPELFLSLRRLLKVSHQHYDIERSGAVKYTRPGSNWRPSACEADVIATRPLVQVIAI